MWDLPQIGDPCVFIGYTPCSYDPAYYSFTCRLQELDLLVSAHAKEMQTRKIDVCFPRFV